MNAGLKPLRADYAFTTPANAYGPKNPPVDIHWFNLVDKIPGHSVGSTVSHRTLEREGYKIPPISRSKPMKADQIHEYQWSKYVPEVQRDVVVTQLRKDNFQASNIDGKLRTNATIGQIAMSHGSGLVVNPMKHSNPPVVEERIPLDSIVALVPPSYKLNYLVINGGKRLNPATPIQMFPGPGFEEVSFKFWGFDNYDVHQAFNVPGGISRDNIVTIDAINYNIILVGNPEGPSVRADYQHKFKQSVVLGFKGMYGRQAIFRFFRALEHMPRLPRDWQYLQFIG